MEAAEASTMAAVAPVKAFFSLSSRSNSSLSETFWCSLSSPYFGDTLKPRCGCHDSNALRRSGGKPKPALFLLLRSSATSAHGPIVGR